ncbi:MAG: hypothetical protein GY938_13870 [Ketobacter sp.]|nr:hypothetical protein [Ketobacter sp.]
MQKEKHHAIKLYDEIISARRDLINSEGGDSSISPFFGVVTVGAVFAVVGALYEMKTKADAENHIKQALSEINNKLDNVLTKIGGIEIQLDDVVHRLEKIGVAIEKLPYENVLLNQRGLIRNISLNISGWVDTISSERTQNEMISALQDLSRFNQSLMMGKYAYAFDVLFGFSTELDLHFMLKSEVSRVKPSVDSVLSFVDQSLELGEPHSMAHRARLLEQRIKDLEEFHAKLDKTEHYLGVEMDNDCANDGYWFAENYYCQLIGDLSAGYSVIHFSKNWRGDIVIEIEVLR